MCQCYHLLAIVLVVGVKKSDVDHVPRSDCASRVCVCHFVVFGFDWKTLKQCSERVDGVDEMLYCQLLLDCLEKIDCHNWWF